MNSTKAQKSLIKKIWLTRKRMRTVKTETKLKKRHTCDKCEKSENSTDFFKTKTFKKLNKL